MEFQSTITAKPQCMWPPAKLTVYSRDCNDTLSNNYVYTWKSHVLTLSSTADRYLEYFTTPYFIFFRDTLSYLFLLGLHIAICLSPSIVPFSAVEWVIAIFFVGRFLSEFKQYNSRKSSKRLEKRKSLSRKHGQYLYQQSGSDRHVDNLDLPIEVEDYHSRLEFSNVGKYFM